MVATAQEALIAELLGDVGKLHDDIKALPESLQAGLAPLMQGLALARLKFDTETVSNSFELAIQKAFNDSKFELVNTLQEATSELNSIADRVANLGIDETALRNMEITLKNVIALNQKMLEQEGRKTIMDHQRQVELMISATAAQAIRGKLDDELEDFKKTARQVVVRVDEAAARTQNPMPSFLMGLGMGVLVTAVTWIGWHWLYGFK